MGIIATRADQNLLEAVHELAEYLDEDTTATAINVGNSFYLVAEEWEKSRPTTPDEICSFYRQCRAYLWNLVLSNYGIPHQVSLRRVVKHLARPGDNVLDLGGGIGSTLLGLKQGCSRCVHADVGGVLFDYARWRYGRAGLLSGDGAYQMVQLDAHYSDSSADPLANRLFDVIVCTEVVEHVPDPEGLVRYIERHMSPGCHLVCTVSFDDDHGLFPCHLNTDRYTNDRFVNEVFPRHGIRQVATDVYMRKQDATTTL